MKYVVNDKNMAISDTATCNASKKGLKEKDCAVESHKNQKGDSLRIALLIFIVNGCRLHQPFLVFKVRMIYSGTRLMIPVGGDTNGIREMKNYK